MWVEPAGQRIVRAAVIGTPNAGKSTLINQLLGHKVAAIIPTSNTCRDHCILLPKLLAPVTTLASFPGPFPFCTHEEERKSVVTRPCMSNLNEIKNQLRNT